MDIGINFRATAGYVTDGANQTYCLMTDFYPVTRGGATFGWEAGGGEVDARDRNSGNDPRLAGQNHSLSTTAPDFRLDVTAGDRLVHAAFGDAGFAHPVGWDVKDGTTTFFTNSGSTSAGQRFDDATGVELTETTWLTNEASVARTFASTILRITPTSAAAAQAIAHVRVNDPPPPQGALGGSFPIKQKAYRPRAFAPGIAR